MRHPASSSDEDRATTVGLLMHGPRGVRHRPAPLVRNSLLGALGLLGLAADRDAARPRPAAGRQAAGTPSGSRGMRVVRDVVGTPILASDLEIGDLVNCRARGVFFDGGRQRRPRHRGRRPPGRQGQGRGHPGPDGARRHHPRPGRENWSVDGIVCYSKICTHVGCPISLYERTTHHLLCPCHQSTFDLADTARSSSARATGPCPSCRSWWTTRATWWRRATSPNPSGPASGSVTTS